MKRIVYLHSVLILAIILLLCASGCGSSTKSEAETYYVTISLDYEEVFLTSNTPLNVYVDNKKIGRQEAGTKVEYPIFLEKGSHEFYLKNDGLYSTEKLTFEVTKDDQSFSFGAKTRLTFGVEVWNK